MIPPLGLSSVQKMDILGIRMHCLSYQELYPIFDAWLADKTGRSHRFAMVNVNVCVSALLKPHLRALYNSADIVGIDSMPFLKWARAFYRQCADHLNAPDLLREVSSKAGAKGYTYFLYGGYPGAPDRIEEYLEQRYEGINVVGKYSPTFRALTKEEDDAICDVINNAHPDFIWIGLGSPKQDIWIQDHLSRLKGSIIMPSGATFDFISGRMRAAPQWVRNLGLEWLYRLTQDFRRLWVRYTVFNLIFVLFFMLQLLHIVSFDSEGTMRILGRQSRFGNVGTSQAKPGHARSEH